jgi:N6-adenosine-specific RNA methylase IME4
VNSHRCFRTNAAPRPFAELPSRQARVILADPPSHFRTYSPKGWKKSVHAKYPCMTSQEIAALPVGELCDPQGCLLVLWATQAQLPAALAVMAPSSAAATSCSGP